MNKEEQDLIRQINEESQDIQVPASLEPKAVEEMLAKRPLKFSERAKNIRWKKSYTAGLAAACCLLVCGVVYNQNKPSVPVSAPTAQESVQSESAEPGQTASESSAYRTAKSYEELYEYLPDYEYINYEEAPTDDMDVEEAADEAQAPTMDAPKGASSEASYAGTSPTDSEMGAAESTAENAGSDYSTTNTREEDVDEADIAKTDGRYIYTLLRDEKKIAIVDTKGGELKQTAQVEPEDLEYIAEFFVSDGKLIVVGEAKHEGEEEEEGEDIVPYGRFYRYWNRSDTTAVTYDLSNPEKPKNVGKVTQSGSYTSSRLTKGYLYILSSYYVERPEVIGDYDGYIPKVNGSLMDEDCIYVPFTKDANMYEVIGAVDIAHPDELTDSKAVFAYGGQLYVSGSNIYWYTEDWSEETTTTIRRIAYKDGRLRAEAVGEVAGHIEDSFSIDEYNGYLRVVTTSYDKNYDETNNVFVLDMDMNIVGKITGLAEEERVYSARLMGDVGYFVTFRETDPLFSVDFSDPENPKIIGELKIPGFSEYLHPYGEGRLLGIGMETDEEGFTTDGVKLSMFDVSDPGDVKETQKFIMKNVYYASVMYDYKAALINPDRNIIAFSAEGDGGESYYVFSYNDKAGFDCKMEEEVNGSGYLAARGVYIGTTLYVVKGNIIEAYEKTADIIL